MWSLVPLLIIPLIVSLGFKFFHPRKQGFTAQEFLALEAGVSVILLLGFLAARWGALQDTEFWNGRVSGKPQGSEHCCHCHQECQTCTDSKGHSYSCNCHEVCSHPLDYWWALDFTTGDRITIESCEPSKGNSPELWDKANIGDPAAIPHGYTNYLLADPESVLMQVADPEQVKSIPEYPPSFAFYRANRAINMGTRMPVDAWNAALMELNADLGSRLQVNIVVVATTNPDPAFAQAVEAAWVYGKKNDVVVVLGAPDGDTVKWAQVVTISHVEMLKILVRDTLVDASLSDVPGTISKIRAAVDGNYTRTSMKEFEYLASAAKPPIWALVLLYLLGIGGTVGGSLYMIENDVFGTERRGWRSGRGTW